MNKNQKQIKAQTKGKHQPRKSTKPKVGASADAIMRRLGTGKYSKASGYLA
jgi:hypothetical protein